MRLIVEEAHDNGSVLVAAAGNSNLGDPFYPAAFEQVISVGATDQNNRRTSFSNYGPTLDVMAPGLNIYSALIDGNNTYGNLSGTSMAAPIVSGLAALIRSHFPNHTPNQVRQTILDGCQSIDAINPGYEGQLGAGIINAAASMGVSSIDDRKENVLKMVYPNPVVPAMEARLLGQHQNVMQLSFTDMTGRTVATTLCSDGRFTVPENLVAGIYAIVATIDKHHQETLRLVVR